MAFDDVPTTRRRMTAEEVLAVFRDRQVDWSGDPHERVGFDTRLDEAIPAIGLDNDVVWGEDRWLWKTVQKLFRISIPRHEWKAALRPWRRHTLGDLCELIASRASVEEIRPVTVLGRPCVAAGAFFAVRGALTAARINVTGVKPSTPLEPMLKRHWDAFLMPLFMLGPGKLPQLSTKEPVPVTLGCRSVTLGLLVLVLAIPAAWLNMPGLAFVAMAAFAAVFLGVLTLSVGTLFPPREVKLGELKTFRDLCLALVDPNGGRNDAQER
jgi:hypothetical protein